MMQIDILAEWLRRETRNLMGFPAQVRILQMSDFLFISAYFTNISSYITDRSLLIQINIKVKVLQEVFC